MSDTRKAHDSKRAGTSRRTFLKAAGATAAATGLGGLGPLMTWVKPAIAADSELKIIQWSHFVPAYDKWIDGFVKEWGEAHKVKATIDHVPHLEIAAKMGAEVSAGAGHDLFGINGFGGAHLYRQSVHDMTKLMTELEKKHGKVSPIGRSMVFDNDTHRWNGFPDYFISFPGLYRKDLWDDIGMKPDTWDNLRIGGAKLKAKGYPIGIPLAHCQDANASWRALMWCYGASEQDKVGKRVTLNSKNTVEAAKVATALFKEAMTPEVLSWDDASNNRYIASGKGSWIHNPISAYRSTQASNPELADKIYLEKTPKGPAAQLASAPPNSYIIWKFSKNIGAAEQFLRDYTAHAKDAFVASTGYNHYTFANVIPKPYPILDNDPSSHPSDKLKILETVNSWHQIYGYPGPETPAVDEVANNFIIPDMMANAATGKMSAEDSVKWAVAEVDKIFTKYIAKA